MFACRYGHKEILEFLHKKGAQLEFERGYNCLHVACYGGDIDTMRYLFETAKVNPNPESQERVPLFLAMTSNVSAHAVMCLETNN